MMLDWLDAEISAAMKRIERVINRKIHFARRSEGQRRRRERERGFERITFIHDYGVVRLRVYSDGEFAP